MMNDMRTITSLLFCAITTVVMAQTTLTVTVDNTWDNDKSDSPVAITLSDYCDFAVHSALVTLGTQEIPCQLDDLNDDDTYDELFFLADIPAKSSSVYTVTLSPEGTPREYTPRVWAQLMIRSLIIKEENKQDLYLASLVFEKGIDPFMTVHQHGVAFENELGAYRIYFDPRQTIDLYGKFTKQLELKATQFYPDAEQKAAGYGDDVLAVGNTVGLGALRGWDGAQATFLDDVNKRGQKVIAYGPLRAIVQLMDRGWTPQPGQQPIDMYETYTIYGGNRAVDVDVTFSRPASDVGLSTGIVNVKGSTEYSAHGLRACWGTDWPAGPPTDTTPEDYKQETVGLAIYVPEEYLAQELPATDTEYLDVLHTDDNQLHYNIMFCSDNESFGYHAAADWFTYLATWQQGLAHPNNITITQ